MKTKTVKSNPKKDLNRAAQLMRTLSQASENKKRLLEKIKNELDAYDKNIKEATAELVEIGTRNKKAFDEKGNLNFEQGYLHITNNVVVVTSKKFDLETFHEAHPELMNIELRKGDIRKAFQDKDFRKELISLGVQVDNEQGMQVILNKA